MIVNTNAGESTAFRCTKMEQLSDALVECGCDLAEVVAAKPNFF
jgi:hypothetical protein|tara:strand:+ start:8854 stop:8985 length:132 start_codon:yes stop_codon:yes gene_type:complete